MKSALELAMEKADNGVDGSEDYVKLSPEQIKAIDRGKAEYEAKWAEQEIVLQGKIQQLAGETDPQTFAEHQSQFKAEMNRVREGIFAERAAALRHVVQRVGQRPDRIVRHCWQQRSASDGSVV